MELCVMDLGTIDFLAAYRLQQQLVNIKIAGESKDYLLLAEHPHVFTTGRGGKSENLPGDDIGTPIFRINRGGDATYHGPGQLVVYPIINLRKHHLDLHLYLRKLEDVLVATLRDFGLRSSVHPPMTGVWTTKGKVASIGIGVRKWTTMHGFSLNVNPDLSFFDRIVPCGLKDIATTSMCAELGSAPSLAEVKARLVSHSKSILIGSRCEHLAG